MRPTLVYASIVLLLALSVAADPNPAPTREILRTEPEAEEDASECDECLLAHIERNWNPIGSNWKFVNDSVWNWTRRQRGSDPGWSRSPMG